ncbi:hypothetical protein [Catenovulum agarivorans]|uniref:hypothetical protein n=1 Tax=Catenovulum agarivorans TaxID=1172192 RepID=UPI000368294B|nr:hypothetical protein [Catenovulum agarivorans]
MSKSKKTYNIKTLGEIGRELNSFKFELEHWEKDNSYGFDRFEIYKKIKKLNIKECDKIFLSNILHGKVKFRGSRANNFRTKLFKSMPAMGICIATEVLEREEAISNKKKGIKILRGDLTPREKAKEEIAEKYGVSVRTIERELTRFKLRKLK